MPQPGRIRQREYVARHPDRARASKIKYRATHHEYELAKSREYNQKNRERKAAKSRAYYWSHREEILVKAKDYAAKNIEKLKAYRRASKDRILATNRAWRAGHPEIVSVYNARTKAKRMGAPGTHTVQEWRDKCALLGNVCIYCGEAKKLTRDHNIPLVRGGSNDISNILPACHSCNSRKKHRTAREFLALRLSA